jgi:hypothetical protein
MSAVTSLRAVVVEAFPAVHEIAIVPVPAEGSVRVHHPAGVRTYHPELPDVPYVVVVPGDGELLGWGWSNGWYGSLAGVRNGHHRLDRDAWHAAARALQGGGVAYVAYAPRLYFGNRRWTATGYRWEPASAERHGNPWNAFASTEARLPGELRRADKIQVHDPDLGWVTALVLDHAVPSAGACSVAVQVPGRAADRVTLPADTAVRLVPRVEVSA